MTFEVVIGRYLEARQDRLRPNTLKAARRYFLEHLKPLHRRPLVDIKRADVAGLLQELVKAHGRYQRRGRATTFRRCSAGR